MLFFVASSWELGLYFFIVFYCYAAMFIAVLTTDINVSVHIKQSFVRIIDVFLVSEYIEVCTSVIRLFWSFQRSNGMKQAACDMVNCH